MHQEHTSPVWINSNSKLEEHCQEWLVLKRIALDTEFIRTDTFYPLPGLIQINTGTDIFLIDPLAINKWRPFLDVLEHSSIIKIFHSCSEDLEVLQLLTGGIPKPLSDTQLTAAFAGIGFSLSYQNLVKRLLGIDIQKDETRSNWRQRPLTASQIKYATLDVVHLLQVYSILENKLEGHPSKVWAEEDCNRMEPTILNNDYDSVWKDVKRAWQLKPRQLLVLKLICIYREEESRKKNLPRNRVIPKSSLWALARYQPSSISSIAKIKDMNPMIIKQYGMALLDIIQTAINTPKEELPEPLSRPKQTKQTRYYADTIKYFILQESEQTGIPVEILLSSKVCKSIIRNGQERNKFFLPDSLQGWRRNVIGKPLIDKLNNL